jgi:hypothetical protein
VTTPSNITPLQRADAYFIAAYWHDEQAAGCDAMAKDDPRLGAEIRKRAAANAVHHRACAAGLRLSATGLLRKDTMQPSRISHTQ